MKTNSEVIQEVIDYIEEHISEQLNLDRISETFHYSKYHLSRMFVNVVGIRIHQYMQRRRLSEAARLLVYTQLSIMEIALYAGYETQQSFTVGFKALFKMSPLAYRKCHAYYPIQLKFHVDHDKLATEAGIMEIKITTCEHMYLIGYSSNTRFGFSVIGQCWRKLHKHKHKLIARTERDFLIGVNDYSTWEDGQVFDYFAGAQVASLVQIPKGMKGKELLAGKYIVFLFKAQCTDSLQPIVEHIYKEWFPHSTCRLNEAAQYDFVKYGEQIDGEGKSLIEYWIPIL